MEGMRPRGAVPFPLDQSILLEKERKHCKQGNPPHVFILDGTACEMGNDWCRRGLLRQSQYSLIESSSLDSVTSSLPATHSPAMTVEEAKHSRDGSGKGRGRTEVGDMARHRENESVSRMQDATYASSQIENLYAP